MILNISRVVDAEMGIAIIDYICECNQLKLNDFGNHSNVVSISQHNELNISILGGNCGENLIPLPNMAKVKILLQH